MVGFICSLLATCEMQGKKPMQIYLPMTMYLRLATELAEQLPGKSGKTVPIALDLTFQNVRIVCGGEVLLIEFEPRSYV